MFIHSGALWSHDFVVKADADAVFFPDRLRPRLHSFVGQRIYTANCGKWPSVPLLYGSIEVFSVPAIQEYASRIQECKDLPWQGWGEDYYMQQCMDLLAVTQAQDFEQVG